LDKNFNPTLEFIFIFLDIFQDKNFPLSDNFKIIDLSNQKEDVEIERNTFIKKRVSDVRLEIRYYCEDKNCAFNEKIEYHGSYSFIINFTGISIEHQTDEILLKYKDLLVEEYPFYFNTQTIRK